MAALSQAVAEYFAEAGVHYSRPGDGPVFAAHFALSAGNAMALVNCEEQAGWVIVRVLLPFNAPTQRRAAVAEFITRVNYNLVLGSFQEDLADGELAFRVTLDVHDDRLTPVLVRNLVTCALDTTNYFYTALAAVALGGIRPLDALEALNRRAAQSVPSSPLTGVTGLTVDLRERLN